MTKLVVENDTLVNKKFVYMFHSYFNDNNINRVHLCDGILCAEKLNWPCLDHMESSLFCEHKYLP
jgi:hypothetical protein